MLRALWALVSLHIGVDMTLYGGDAPPHSWSRVGYSIMAALAFLGAILTYAPSWREQKKLQELTEKQEE